MSFALTVLTIGLAVAALAGIPALLGIGGWLSGIGLAVAMVGLVLTCTEVPGQRAASARLRLWRDMDIQLLKDERRVLMIKRTHLEGLAKSNRSKGWDPATMRVAIDLAVRLSEVDMALRSNADGFARLDTEPSTGST